MAITTKSELIQALRDAADFFESTDLGLPHLEGGKIRFGYYNRLYNDGPSVDSKAGLAQFSRMMDHVEKDANDSFYYLSACPAENVEIRAVATRYAICQRVKVGEKEVPEHVKPAVEAKPELVVPAHTEPVFDWVCPSILNGEGENHGE